MALLYSVTFLDLVQVGDDIQVLAISRGGDLSNWNLPGGKVEAGESFEDAAVRELLEETGVQVSEVFPVHRALCEGETPFFNTTFMGRGMVYPPQLPTTREGTVAWKPLQALYLGSFSQHNIKMFKALGLA